MSEFPKLDKPANRMIFPILKAIKEWESENTPEVLEERVKKTLNENSKEIVAKLLGFNNHWGKWEIDNCNGRDRYTEAGRRIVALHQKAVDEWFHEISDFKLTPKEKSAFRAAYKKSFFDMFTYHVRIAAEKQAEQVANDLVQEIVGTPTSAIEKINRMLSLIEES